MASSLYLLFIIPMVLAFLAIIGLVYYTHRRREILKARRSTLRNVTYVLEEDEKIRAKQQRLSRMGSTRSGLSRMTSTKSSYSRSAIGRDVEREHRRLRATTTSHSKSKSDSTKSGNSPGELEKGLHTPQDQIHVIGRAGDGNDAVRDDDNNHNANVNRRKEMLSVIGESGENSRILQQDAGDQSFPSQQLVEEPAVVSSSTPSKPIQSTSEHPRQASASTSKRSDSGGDPFISPATAIGRNNPFASPQSSTSDHEVNASASLSASAPSQIKVGLGRKLSEVIRLRSPIPPAKSNSTSTKDTASSDARTSRTSPMTTTKVSSDTFGVRATRRPSGSGSASGNQSQSQSQANQLPVPVPNRRTSTSSSRSITTQMIGAPSSSSSPRMVASPIRSNSLEASKSIAGADGMNANPNPDPNPVGGSEWTYTSRANEWRKPRKSFDGLNENKDSSNQNPNPLGLSNVTSKSSLKAQSATHLPLPKGNKKNSGDGLKRAASIGAAGSKFKETFEDLP